MEFGMTPEEIEEEEKYEKWTKTTNRDEYIKLGLELGMTRAELEETVDLDIECTKIMLGEIVYDIETRQYITLTSGQSED